MRDFFFPSFFAICICIYTLFFPSSLLADFKENAIMNLSTKNNTRTMKKLTNNSVKNITSKIHGQGLFIYLFLHTTNEMKKERKEKSK